MKSKMLLVTLLVATLPSFTYAADGAQALERFQQRNKIEFAQQAKTQEERQQQALQASKESPKAAPCAEHPSDGQAAN